MNMKDIKQTASRKNLGLNTVKTKLWDQYLSKNKFIDTISNIWQ